MKCHNCNKNIINIFNGKSVAVLNNTKYVLKNLPNGYVSYVKYEKVFCNFNCFKPYAASLKPKVEENENV